MRGELRNRDGDIAFTVHSENDYKAMENHRAVCAFYLKTGVCRFGNECSMDHFTLMRSPTILIRNFFYHGYLEDLAHRVDDLDNNSKTVPRDMAEEEDMYAAYQRFYHDVMERFSAAGRIIWFKCCRNLNPHLRGNTYIQFEDEVSAREAVAMFNGVYYKDRRLEVDLTPITMWKLSICGLYDSKNPVGCPHGDGCNYLHPFINPDNEFSGRSLNLIHHTEFPRHYTVVRNVEPSRRERTTTHHDSTNISPTMGWNKNLHDYNNNNKPANNNNGASQILCEFYTKTHACRFGDACIHKHPQPEESSSIIVKNLFDHRLLGNYNLHHDEERQLQQDYRRFYEDVIIKFRCVGPIVMVKCARNCGDHLRGNLYVTYADKKHAKEAVALLNGHVYQGNAMNVQLSNVENWVAALCGRDPERLCERGNICNLIHCFRNPHNEYRGITTEEKRETQRHDADRNGTSRYAYRRHENPVKRVKQETGDCEFYNLTGACKDGRKCRKDHIRYKSTSTIMIKNFFHHKYLDQYDEPDADNSNEGDKDHDELDLMQAYGKFYEVVLTKFRSIGPVIMFKSCRNFTPHLRGNVYVEFSEEKYAQDAIRLLDGYCHEGKQLEMFLSPVSRWRSAICKCNHPKSCNYLHVFRNPADEYDVPDSEEKKNDLRKENRPSVHSADEGRRKRKYSPSRSHNERSVRRHKSPLRSSMHHSNIKREETHHGRYKRDRSPLNWRAKRAPQGECVSYFKRGLCQFGDRCRNRHGGAEGTTIMAVLNYFRMNDWGGEEDEQAKYEQFFDEALEKFQSIGTVVMFKCCRNEELLLNGTVYVQYSSHEEVLEAHEKFNGLSFLGRTLEAELCPSNMDWNRAICGQFYSNGECFYTVRKFCPGLHVYHNPDGQFPRPSSYFDEVNHGNGDYRKPGVPFGSSETSDVTMWL